MHDMEPDRIHIRDLLLRCIIGFNDDERRENGGRHGQTQQAHCGEDAGAYDVLLLFGELNGE